MDLRDDLRKLAARQQGVASTDQFRLLGGSRQNLRSCHQSGEWELITPRVLRTTGAPVTDAQLAMTAVLDAGPGAVLSHQSALALYGVPGFALAPHHVSHPRGGIRRDEMRGVMHTSRRLPPHHITVLDGIPVTRPHRSLFDIAAKVPVGRLERALDNCWSNRFVSGPLLFAIGDELGRRGRAGTQLWRELIEMRGLDYVPAASNLEGRFHGLVAADGQPPLDRQVDLGDALSWCGRVDAHDRPARVVFEVNSDKFHTSLLDVTADAAREERLIRAGLHVVTLSEHQIWHRGTEVQEITFQERQAGRRRHGERPLIRSYAAA